VTCCEYPHWYACIQSSSSVQYMCCEHALTLGGRMVICGEADVRRGNCPVADMIVVVII